MSRTLIALALAVCFGAAQDKKPPVKTPDPVELARAKNLKTYQARYVPQRDRLTKAKAKGWVVIVEGMLLPVDGDGNVEPAATWEEVERQARRLHPGAVHRFVFRVGEDGDSSHFYTLGEFPHGIGSGLVKAVTKATRSKWWSNPHDIWLEGGTSEGVISVRDEKGYPWVPLTVTAPGGETKVQHRFGFASAFPGPAVVSKKTARKLGLALWEIPGTMALNKTRKCRRARCHFELKKPDGKPATTVTCDVAIWPL